MRRFLNAVGGGMVLIVLASCGKNAVTPKNNPPEISTAPQGVSSGYVGQNYFFTAEVTDPEGDSVAVRFDFGDGTVSDWTAYFLPPNENMGSSHAYSEAGTYTVKAQAKDTHGAMSEWSPPHQVTIEVFPFAITAHAYDDSDDLNAAVQSEFGPDYRVADWNDVKDWCSTHSAYKFISILNWQSGESHSLLVTWNGESYYEGWRHYYMTRVDHNPPPGYLVHDDIEDNYIVLGSWSPVTMHVLGIKEGRGSKIR